MRTRGYLSLLLVLLTPSIARGNGGPVAWTDATPGGGITPVSQSQISLTRERLAITIEDDARHYRARACYLLANPGTARTVEFGVPLLYTTDPYGEQTSAELTPGARAAAKSIEIRVGKKRYGCQLRGPSAEVDALPAARRAWCVTRVTIPSGAAVPLVLAYRGELLFEDAEFSKSALTVFDDRRLYYELFPAGYWAGKTKRVSIEVDLGRFAGLARLDGDDATAPHPTRVAGGKLTWSFSDVDLTAAGALDLRIDAEPVLRSDQLTRWNQSHNQGMAIKASSTLADQGTASYHAEGSIDGDPATAWCEGSTGDGIGEWLELSLPRPTEQCRLEGFAITTGYTKSAKSYRDNNRVARISLSRCGDTAPLDRFDLDVDDHYDRATKMVLAGGDDWDPQAGSCYRITIQKVARGARHRDTCISEIAPVFNCN